MASRTVNIIVRYAVASVGLFMIAFAIALAIKSNLGTAPLSCMAYVLNLDMPGISVGTFTFLVNMLYILIQLAVLRRRFKAVHLMQVVASVLFGYMIDLSLSAFSSTFHKEFGKVKMVMDSSVVVISALLAFIFFGNFFGSGEFTGLVDVLLARTPGVVIGLGTLLMAFLPGYLMRFTDPLVARFSRRAS